MKIKIQIISNTGKVITENVINPRSNLTQLFIQPIKCEDGYEINSIFCCTNYMPNFYEEDFNNEDILF